MGSTHVGEAEALPGDEDDRYADHEQLRVRTNSSLMLSL
jgi:hypothetical protein